MNAEEDPIQRFAAMVLLFAIAIVLDVPRTLFSRIAGGNTLVLTIAAFEGGGSKVRSLPSMPSSSCSLSTT